MALAHTDYDWKIHRGEPKPPPHAAASTIYGNNYLLDLPDHERVAILLAVHAHHGGTIYGGGDAMADPPHALAAVSAEKVGLGPIIPAKPDKLFMYLHDQLCENFESVWSLAAILSRVLRLSDQKATAEGSGD